MDLEQLAKEILVLGNDHYLSKSSQWKELVNKAKEALRIPQTEYPYIIHYCYGGPYKGANQYKEIVMANSAEQAKHKYFDIEQHRYEEIYSITQVS